MFGLTATAIEQQPGAPAVDCRGDAPVLVRRSGDGFVGLDLRAGQHRVDLRFTGARPEPLGVVLTLAGCWASLSSAAAAAAAEHRRRPAGPGAAACPG